MKRALLLLGILPALLFSQSAFAQFKPPAACAANLSGNMICALPELYGATGLTLANPNHSAHFVSSFQENFAPLTLAVGTELSLLSIASPASGVLFTFDKSLGVVTRSTESYGPIMAERGETIGRHRLYLAGSYQFYGFSTLDGIDLKHIPATFSHAEFPINGVIPNFERDFITTDNRIDLKVHQITFFATYGLTDRIDISAAIPILDVRLGVSSSALIHRIAPPDRTNPSAEPVTGQYHYFSAADPNGSISSNFSTGAKSSSGIGDVVFRVKGTVLKGERGRLALGLDVRTPTGDEKNFLGAGAPGVKPFAAVSYRARVSPHANLGFEYNGQSILAGNVGTGKTGKLPNELFYSAGVDVGATKKLTAAVDYLGTRLSNSERVKETSFTNPFGTTFPDIAQTVLVREAFTTSDLSVGAKYSPFNNNLLFTGNVIIALDKNGLRAKVVPLAGISYTF